MKLCTSWIAGALVALAVGVSTARAADQYWDINGTTDGATDDGSGIASGAATGAFWNSDPTGGAAGTIGTFTTGNRAVFSAGTNATASTTSNGFSNIVSANLGTTGAAGVGALSGILVEEGELRPTGVLSMITGAVIEMMPGTEITQSGVNLSAPTGSTFTIKMNGTTSILRSTNGGGAGSFVSTLGSVQLVGGGTWDYAPAALIIFNTTSNLTGTGPLIKTGAGVIGFAGTGTYSGATIINDGEIRVRTNNNRLPVGTDVTINSPGVLNLNGLQQTIASLTGTGNVGTGSGTLTINGSTSTSFDGALKNVANFPSGAFPGVGSGFGRLIKSGSSTITFNGQNDISGSVTLNAGGILVAPGGSLCGPVADIVINGGTLTLNNGAQSVENFGGSVGGTFLDNGTILTIDPAGGATVANNTYSGPISGTGGIKKMNTIAGGMYKTLTLSGANTYQGGTEVVGGRLNSNSATGTGSGAVTINTNGVLGGSGHVTGAITAQVGGSLSGGLGLGDGTALTVDNTVDIQAGGGLNFVIGGRVGDYNDNGVVDGADYVVFRNAAAADTLPNDVTPGVVDASDYTQFRNHFGSTTGNADKVISTAANAISLAAGSLFTVSAGPVAPIPGTYTVLEYNTGHTGTLASMNINNATGLELTSVVDNTIAKTFEVTLSSTPQTRSWTDSVINGNWSADPAEAGNWTPSGQPNGPGAVGTFAGTNAHVVTIADSDKTLGTMTLSNANGYTIAATGANHLIMNTFTGTPAISVTSGTHEISAPMILTKATTATVSAGADLTLSGEVTNAAGLTKAGVGTMTASGVVRSTSTVTVSGGTLTLSGANTYSGATSIAVGAILNANNTGATSATGTGAITVNGTLNVNGRTTGATTIPAGGVANVAGTATGAQTVSGGIVDLGTAGVLTGTATLSAGGILQNAPTFTSSIQTAGMTLNSTGHMAPGGIGALGALSSSTTGAVAFNAGSVFDIDIGSAGFDQFLMGNTTANTVGLTIAAGAIIKINDIGGMADGTYQIMTLGATPNAATIALAANWLFTGSTAGHTYGVSITGTAVNVSVTTPGVGSGSAVPEPTTIGLVTIALMAFATGRRNRKA